MLVLLGHKGYFPTVPQVAPVNMLKCIKFWPLTFI